jgi:hypothetical protein
MPHLLPHGQRAENKWNFRAFPISFLTQDFGRSAAFILGCAIVRFQRLAWLSLNT